MSKILSYKVIRRLAVVLFALIGTSGVALASAYPGDERVTVPAGEQRATTLADLAPHAATTGAFNERWSYLFMLNDGLQLHLNFSLAHLSGLRSAAVGADLGVLGFEGRDYYVAREYAQENRFRYDASVPRFNAHPQIFFEGAPPRRHRVFFDTEKEGVHYEVDLTFSDMVAGVTWGDGVFTLGGERLGMYVHIPYARVSGTVALNGVRKQVRGTAYMDHTFQTAYAPRLVRSAYRFARHTGTGWEAGYFILPNDRYEDRVVGFGLRRQGGQAELLKPSALEIPATRRKLGVAVPQQLVVHFEGGRRTILSRRGDRQAFSALQDLGGLARAVVTRFIGGEVVYFRGTGTVGSGERAAFDFLLVK